ncbi:hypothetical protein [Xanthomonas graminis]|uniref:hypothetical protein n=1 Tax=Xanthomonas graminis TaxID=3390026 RepID=UPI00253F8F06|nr:hypothetical protein [Xanthomonas translucens]
MRIERLDVVLRARSAWEAMELGSALVRRHAGAIWKPWLLISVPLFALLNLGAWAIDQLWLAGLLLWWLKPVLDRIPLFVISRGVFGDVPSVRDTLRAQLGWGWRPMLGYLTWRRLSPARTVLMPLELLEGASAEQQRQRRRTLGGAVYGHALLLASVCWHFEAMLLLACIAAIAMFVPVDLLPETARAAWALIGDENPVWADVGLNAFGWLATTLIEPFFVGAGFGLYLNRRTEIEAWDVEMALRRLRDRLGGAAPLLLALVLLGVPGAALRAQTAAPGSEGPVAADPHALSPLRRRKRRTTPPTPRTTAPRWAIRTRLRTMEMTKTKTLPSLPRSTTSSTPCPPPTRASTAPPTAPTRIRCCRASAASATGRSATATTTTRNPSRTRSIRASARACWRAWRPCSRSSANGACGCWPACWCWSCC